MRPKLLRQFWFRLALLQAGVSAILASVLFGGLYLATTHYAKKQLKDEIERDSAALVVEAGANGDGLLDVVRRRAALTSKTAWYELVDARGRVLAGNMWPEGIEPGWHTFPMPDTNPDDDEADEHSLLTLVVAVPPNYRLAVARDTYRQKELEESFAEAFSWVLLLAVLSGLAAALLVARALRRRVAPLIATASAVGAGDLRRRVPVDEPGDEFDGVARAVNDMLHRTEHLLQRVRQVSVDVSHDLRTPLARVRQRLERLHDDLGSNQSQTEVRSVIEDLDAAFSTFDAILRLARIEEGAAQASFETIDMSALIAELAEVYGPVAEDAQKLLIAEIEAAVQMQGDRPMLVQMVVNVLENAIRHTPKHTVIRLGLSHGVDNSIVVDVIDNGQGISAVDRERAVLPHVRLDPSRSGEGSGLGLALCKAIVELHGGRLALLNANPGLHVQLVLPAQEQR